MKNILEKLPKLVKSFKGEIFLGICIILISIISYNLGRINSHEKASIKIGDGAVPILSPSEPQNRGSSISQPNLKNLGEIGTNTQPQKLDTRVVVSKNSDKYHYTTRHL